MSERELVERPRKQKGHGLCRDAPTAGTTLRAGDSGRDEAPGRAEGEPSVLRILVLILRVRWRHCRTCKQGLAGQNVFTKDLSTAAW